MRDSTFSWDLFNPVPIVGIVRHVGVEQVRQLLPVYRDAGLTTIEITLNTSGAEAMIRAATLQHPTGLNVGAGTVCSMADLDRALAAGAQFIVTPIINKLVIEACVGRGVPIFPGAFTPSEIYEAWTLGASLVKVFPTTALGPTYIQDIKGPLNDIKLLPTGGIGLANMCDFIQAGANGVGIGSQLFDKHLIEQRDWPALKIHFGKFINQLANVLPRAQTNTI